MEVKKDRAYPGVNMKDTRGGTINFHPTESEVTEIDISKGYVPKSQEAKTNGFWICPLVTGTINVQLIGRGVAWLDTGTPASLLQASNFFGVIEERQGLKVACIEEIAYKKNFINKNELKSLISEMPNSFYRDYLVRMENE